MADVDELEITRILTDSDLDGVLSGAILLRRWPEAEVVFGHPGALKTDFMMILSTTRPQSAICPTTQSVVCP